MPIEKHPLYTKAVTIVELVDQITDLVSKAAADQDDEMTQTKWVELAHYLDQEAQILTKKTTQGLSAILYDLQMENATLIRKAATDILLHLSSLEIYGFKETEYLDLIRYEIDEFRKLFAQWVQTFNPWRYQIDRWGLFNPPGIAYDAPEEKDFPNLNYDEIDDLGEIDPDEWDELDEED